MMEDIWAIFFFFSIFTSAIILLLPRVHVMLSHQGNAVEQYEPSTAIDSLAVSSNSKV